MARRSALQKSRGAILAHFANANRRVYTQADLAEVLSRHRAQWRIPYAVTREPFISFLETEGRLRKQPLPATLGPAASRYVWETPSPFELALSLRSGGYLSHGTAAYLHGLTEQVPKVIYVNKEQSPKPKPAGKLNQAAIERAFQNQQRATNLEYTFDSLRIAVLSGMNTKDLEVSEETGPNGEPLRYTRLERTLIDIAVRPAYAGGVFEVARMYERALGRMSIATLVATLKQIGYVYPYHQAIGFYLQRAGAPEGALARLRDLGIHFKFYVAHGIAQPNFSAEWKLFFPDGL